MCCSPVQAREPGDARYKQIQGIPSFQVDPGHKTLRVQSDRSAPSPPQESPEHLPFGERAGSRGGSGLLTEMSMTKLYAVKSSVRSEIRLPRQNESPSREQLKPSQVFMKGVDSKALTSRTTTSPFAVLVPPLST